MKVYALKNYESPESSSGGAFPAIADTVADIYGSNLIVYGAVFDKEFHVKHIPVNYRQRDALSKLKGSKYVRSDISDVYLGVKNYLHRGLPVLFIGTPCQVESLRRRLILDKIDTKLLILVDLICHGTPKPEIWHQYLNLIKEKYHSDIEHISFRYKGKKSDADGRLYVKFTNGTESYRLNELLNYMRLFSTYKSIYKGCFACPFRNSELKRPADITIGDFWGVSEIFEDFKNIGDVSLVLTHTFKGQAVIDKIINRINYGGCNIIVRGCDSNSYLVFNPHLVSQTTVPDDYNEFWKDYNTLPFAELDRKYAKTSFCYRFRRALIDTLSVLGLKWKLKYWLQKLKLAEK